MGVELQQYDFKTRYRKGKQNIVADMLSLQPLGEEACRLVKKKEMPAGKGCRWLTKLCQDLKRASHKFFRLYGGVWHIPHQAGHEDVAAWKLCVHAALQKAFRERILPRFGTPKVLITGNCTQFTSRAFKVFLEELGVRHQLTAPYTPQENPTARANRKVKTMIAQFTGGDQRCWDDALPELTLGVSSSVSASTGYSAAFIKQWHRA
ncbi:hypothetical protein AWZ03_014958 [Drosophila navojoa]|uniref:Integrase catalytic domain-containing protein n=1 Tax=Drosophila navojoa TaxID=7232 RepID=A0A484ARD4_DRONA|nr:hypothetical protein AWZ03_014958 [Drosophila navojoa]